VKLEAAADDLADGDVEAACRHLEAFRHEVEAQRGKAVGASTADALLHALDALEAALGC
jgi:hypothetical protein